LRLRSTVDSIIKQNIKEQDDSYIMEVFNISNFYINNFFILFKNNIVNIDDIPVDSSVSVKIFKETDEVEKKLTIYNKNTYLNTIANIYINYPYNSDNNDIIFCGFIGEEINPVEFSIKSWKKKSTNMVIFRYSPPMEDNNEKPSI